ncbi:MAG: hypothetical protein KDD22_01915, partial [Bdellovibrionales bacterium]|nr:hypothetical protein [Bdellovibrionales bacterium]
MKPKCTIQKFLDSVSTAATGLGDCVSSCLLVGILSITILGCGTNFQSARQRSETAFNSNDPRIPN